jgi:thioredoxin 2
VAAPIITCPHCGKRNRVPARAEGIPRCANCHNLLPWAVDADSSSFDAEVDASIPVLVDFWAAWCGPCKWVTPTIEALANEKAGQLKVVRLDVDKEPAIASRYGVQGIPTLLLMRAGEEVDRLVGAASKDQLESWLQSQLGLAPAR